MRGTRQWLVAVAVSLLSVSAQAGISAITAHNESYSPGDTIPLFVDPSTKNSVIVKGTFMDLCTGVESSDGSFVPSIGRRFVGSNSAVEILIGAGSAPDLDTATITIKFVAGQETFKVKAYKTVITGYTLVGRSSANCSVGSSYTLEVRGSVANLVKGTIGTMLDGIDDRYELHGKLATSTDTTARFSLKCTGVGTFIVKPTWFKDSRVADDVAEVIPRGATFSVNVVEISSTTKTPVP